MVNGEREEEGNQNIFLSCLSSFICFISNHYKKRKRWCEKMRIEDEMMVNHEMDKMVNHEMDEMVNDEMKRNENEMVDFSSSINFQANQIYHLPSSQEDNEKNENSSHNQPPSPSNFDDQPPPPSSHSINFSSSSTIIYHDNLKNQYTISSSKLQTINQKEDEIDKIDDDSLYYSSFQNWILEKYLPFLSLFYIKIMICLIFGLIFGLSVHYSSQLTKVRKK